MDMWNGHLDFVKEVKNRIDLDIPKYKSVNYTPQISGTAAKQL